MKPRYPLLILLATLASALVLAACGGDDDGGEEAAQQETAPAETAGGGGQEAADVSLSEFEFDPADVTATAGTTITLENVGSEGHDLRLRQGGKDIGGTDVFDAGQSEELKVDFEPGKYEMFCSVPGHEDAGMKGTFTVK